MEPINNNFLDAIMAEDDMNSIILTTEDAYDDLNLAITTAMAMDKDELSSESLDIINNYTGLDISTEANVVNEFKNKLNALYRSLNGYVYKQFKGFSALTDITSEYRTNELIKLKNMIAKGELIPVDKVDMNKAKSLNNRLAPFYASGYSLKSNASDLNSYITGMFSLTSRTGKYLNGLYNMFEKLSTSEPELNVPKLNGLLNVKKGLTGLTSTVDRKRTITDFRLSILYKFISSDVKVLFVSNSTKRGIRVHIDKYTINTDRPIGKANNNITLALLDTAIKNASNLKNVHNGLSFNIKKLTRDNTLQLISSVTGEGARHRFLVAKYAETVSKSLINLYIDCVNSDRLVIDYIRLTYRKA